jgi:hypothetical protein
MYSGPVTLSNMCNFNDSILKKMVHFLIPYIYIYIYLIYILVYNVLYCKINTSH